jgi:putative peptide zinc metalloprotease protein
MQLQQGIPAGRIAGKIHHRFGQQLSTESVAAASADLLTRVRDVSATVTRTSRRRYVFRIRLLPESVVARIARALSGLFSPIPAVLYGCWLVTAAVLLLSGGSVSSVAGQETGASFLLAYLFFLLAVAGHELGHAAACVRYGARPGDIGFAVYLVFPAVYCDVTRAWLLPRRQRVVVDIAGLVFEIGIGAGYVIGGILLHLPVLVLASLLVLGNLVIILNPLGRFDSYWVLSDALGIADLAGERSRMLRSAFRRRRADPGRAQAVHTGFRRTFVLCYSAGTLLILGWFGYTLTGFTGPAASHIASELALIGKGVTHAKLALAGRALLDVVPSLAMLGFLFYRLARTLLLAALRPLAARRRRSRDQPDMKLPAQA